MRRADYLARVAPVLLLVHNWYTGAFSIPSILLNRATIIKEFITFLIVAFKIIKLLIKYFNSRAAIRTSL